MPRPRPLETVSVEALRRRVVRALQAERGAPREATEDAFARAAERRALALGLSEVRR